MTDIQAAIGREQLKQFKDFKKKRDLIFSTYKSSGLDLLDSDDDKYTPIRYRAVLKTKQPIKLINQLNNNGIKSIVPIEKDELLGKPENYINAKELSENTVSIPIYPSLDLGGVNKICDTVSRFEGIA